MRKRKMIKLPAARTEGSSHKRLPFNGRAVKDGSFSFSFACFDRSAELFNLGDSNSTGVMSGNWFLDLLDCFKSVNNMSLLDVKRSLHDLHPIDWSKTNAKPPAGSDQIEYWQFRVNKSKGRVIGFFIDSVFYIVWLDPHHNLTNSEGYGTEVYYQGPSSEYEILVNENEYLKQENDHLKKDVEAAETLMYEINVNGQEEQVEQIAKLEW